MSTFSREVLKPVKDALDGKVLQVQFHLERFNEVTSMRKAVYTLIGGNTG